MRPLALAQRAIAAAEPHMPEPGWGWALLVVVIPPNGTTQQPAYSMSPGRPRNGVPALLRALADAVEQRQGAA